MNEISKQIAELLLDSSAVKVKLNPPFTWVSGIKSPVYCDNRKIISYPKERKMIVQAFIDIIKSKNIQADVIGGTATAAIPWAAFLAYEFDKPMIYIRPEKKEHGTGKQIEGELKPGQKVLIVEDLISTGGSSIKAVNAVREEGGCEVSDVLAIVTWEIEKSIEIFAEEKINLYTLTGFTELIGSALKRGYVSAEEYDKILDFKKDPALWGAKMGF